MFLTDTYLFLPPDHNFAWNRRSCISPIPVCTNIGYMNIEIPKIPTTTGNANIAVIRTKRTMCHNIKPLLCELSLILFCSLFVFFSKDTKMQK